VLVSVETSPSVGPGDAAKIPAYDHPALENPASDERPDMNDEDEHPSDARRGRIGINLLGGYNPILEAHDEVAGQGLLGVELLDGGMLGAKRRILLAAHVNVLVGVAVPVRLPFSGYSVGLLGQQNWVLGRRDQFLVGVGGIVAVTGQKLGIREIGGMTHSYFCDIGSETATARRMGGLLSPRFEFAILFGPRRRGMSSLGVEPSFAIFGDGPKPVDPNSLPGFCGPSVFTHFGAAQPVASAAIRQRVASARHADTPTAPRR
jgi:hypothetical protein